MITYRNHTDFTNLVHTLARDLADTEPVHRGEWQSMDVSNSSLHKTYELQNVIVQTSVPHYQWTAADVFGADIPWAEAHFQERVSGHPHNPPPSHVDWPYAKRGNGDHTDQAGKFDHTYPERFWPKLAGDQWDTSEGNIVGIRFEYGDLGDVVDLLKTSPMTRQAYLPVWFPEDTGGHVRLQARVPCTLGYHFLMRPDWTLDINYFMRSCDMVRHFRNDVYLSARLLQWVVKSIGHQGIHPPVSVGNLTMFISCMHAMTGDLAALMRLMVG